MKRLLLAVLPLLFLYSCKEKSGEEKLELNGVITNNTAKMIYLEEVPMTTMQRVIMDSAALGADGKFKLKTTTGEARVYNLRLDQSSYPLAAVINDAKKITVNVKFSKENTQFPESYEVKNSPVSQELKDYVTGFNNKFQLIMSQARIYDSLGRTGATSEDSSLLAIRNTVEGIATDIKTITMDALKKKQEPCTVYVYPGLLPKYIQYAGIRTHGSQ
ncbi:MAG: DUF4369 domain-containing protein [Chitinophagaceae bacterium]|nr:DUF4369 domain-containing protein [Chitinophagaceae bacterium]